MAGSKSFRKRFKWLITALLLLGLSVAFFEDLATWCTDSMVQETLVDPGSWGQMLSGPASHIRVSTVHPSTQLGENECESKRPNLILSAISGAEWQDQLVIFLNSLEASLGRETLLAIQQHTCPPAPVHVKITVPGALAKDLPKGFQEIAKRFAFVEFVGPDEKVHGQWAPLVFWRFGAWSALIGDASDPQSLAVKYDKVLAIDLDSVFQRNPFDMPLKHGSSLAYFAEWTGLRIGQCKYHLRWFDECEKAKGGPYITQQQIDDLGDFERICAGSVYGTAKAMSVYLQTMSKTLLDSHFRCNDQALHIHLFYSGLMRQRLKNAGVGSLWLVPNNESLLGTVGTTPIIRFNAWGEMLNDVGDVQTVIHQYKHHPRLRDLVEKKYGEVVDVGRTDIPDMPTMKRETDSIGLTRPRWVMNATSKFCEQFPRAMCSCAKDSCQVEYNDYWY
ncbi:hypothetical protein YB2330_005998 [Saitoella coloradoensis]